MYTGGDIVCTNDSHVGSIRTLYTSVAGLQVKLQIIRTRVRPVKQRIRDINPTLRTPGTAYVRQVAHVSLTSDITVIPLNADPV
jgi:hypothetical protein